MNTINIGISKEDRGLVADQLKVFNFHWNITGPSFIQLHTLFEEHYTELAVAVDDVAERIRSLGVHAPGTYKEFSELSSIKEVSGTPEAQEMVAILTANHEQLVRTCRTALSVAQEADDESSAALISDRMRVHEKTAWMLRSQIS